jgi:lipopolysaccharide biosynthesis protein
MRPPKPESENILKNFISNGFVLRPIGQLWRRVKRRTQSVAAALTRPKARPAAMDYSMRVPFGYPVPSSSPAQRKIAAICHIYYPELAAEIRGYLENIPPDADVFISTDDAAKADWINLAFSGWGKGQVIVRIVPNQGRDIAPKLITFKEVYGRYDLVIFLHSKKTEFSTIGQQWRMTLMQNLAGSPGIVDSILEAFDFNPRLGLVMSQHFEPIRRYVDWGDNFKAAARLARSMGFKMKASRPFDFPAGSMFWARPEALQPLLELHLTLDEFPIEAGQIDGTIAHAIERLLLYACEHSGYSWIKVADPLMFDNRATIVPVPTPAALKYFMESYGISLLQAKGRRIK